LTLGPGSDIVHGISLVFCFTEKEVAMLQKAAQLFAIVALLTLVILATASAQTAGAKSAEAAKTKKPAASKMTDAQKIALAMSAAPIEIARNATITDMSSMPPKQLRAGTNGWVCSAPMDAPMCLDKEWQKWAEAWMSKKELKIEGTGIAYMLRGDHGASNTDPYATGPTADNQWVVSPSHLMLLFEDLKMLDAYPTDPKNGGPWVMWKGTPYAHLMVPVSPTKAVTMSSK
jgi:hypothetical protein